MKSANILQLLFLFIGLVFQILISSIDASYASIGFFINTIIIILSLLYALNKNNEEYKVKDKLIDIKYELKNIKEKYLILNYLNESKIKLNKIKKK